MRWGLIPLRRRDGWRYRLRLPARIIPSRLIFAFCLRSAALLSRITRVMGSSSDTFMAGLSGKKFHSTHRKQLGRRRVRDFSLQRWTQQQGDRMQSNKSRAQSPRWLMWPLLRQTRAGSSMPAEHYQQQPPPSEVDIDTKIDSRWGRTSIDSMNNKGAASCLAREKRDYACIKHVRIVASGLRNEE